MKISKILTTVIMFFSISYSANSFKNYSDMCQNDTKNSCLNRYNEVRNLQIALNSDKHLNVNLKIDGKWGNNTQNAVKKFQKLYNIKPSQGYVGAKTKRKLDILYNKLKFNHRVKDKISSKIVASNSLCYADFKRTTNLKKSYKIFKDRKLLSKANGKNTKLKVNISQQRINLYVNGKVALSSPCTTGAKRKLEPNTRVIRDKRTPKGIFKIKEKIADKRSSIFGKFYINGRLVYKGDRRKYRGPKNAKYVGASLKHWMRLTDSGIGLHASKYIKRYPGTNGCIRLPYKVAKLLFSKVNKGTRVVID
jgi:peptidoglycan hydrolase-like protein with peptidoglycan-binding domain